MITLDQVVEEIKKRDKKSFVTGKYVSKKTILIRFDDNSIYSLGNMGTDEPWTYFDATGAAFLKKYETFIL